MLGTRIEAAQPTIGNTLFARYALTKFFLVYVLRLILENDATASLVIEEPQQFVSQAGPRQQFCTCIDKILSEVVTDLNAEIDQLGEDFDYRGKLRDEKWCKELAHEVAATHKTLVDRGRLDSFDQTYQESAQ